MDNTKRLDAAYFTNKLGIVVRDVSHYTPQEMARELVRLAKVADEGEAVTEAARSAVPAQAGAEVVAWRAPNGTIRESKRDLLSVGFVDVDLRPLGFIDAVYPQGEHSAGVALSPEQIAVLHRACNTLALNGKAEAANLIRGLAGVTVDTPIATAQGDGEHSGRVAEVSDEQIQVAWYSITWDGQKGLAWNIVARGRAIIAAAHKAQQEQP